MANTMPLNFKPHTYKGAKTMLNNGKMYTSSYGESNPGSFSVGAIAFILLALAFCCWLVMPGNDLPTAPTGGDFWDDLLRAFGL